MNSILNSLALRAINVRKLLQLQAAAKHRDALEAQHTHGGFDALSYDSLGERLPVRERDGGTTFWRLT